MENHLDTAAMEQCRNLGQDPYQKRQGHDSDSDNLALSRKLSRDTQWKRRSYPKIHV